MNEEGRRQNGEWSKHGKASSILVEGKANEEQANTPFAHFRSVSPDYFKVMGIPLIRGREFSERDDADAPSVAVINDIMAKKYWPNEDPIGKRVKEGSNEAVWREIVGIIGGVRHQTRAKDPEPEMFVPWNQRPDSAVNLAIRMSAEGKIKGDIEIFEHQQSVAKGTWSAARPKN